MARLALAATVAAGACASKGPTVMDEHAAATTMVNTQIRARGVLDEAVLDAMARVPRHLFVPPDLHARAYDDTPLPIGYGQTISQPYIVGYMTEALQLTGVDRVLEIGTGSGYQAAVLAELVPEVYSIEIVPELAAQASRVLEEAGYRNVQVKAGDGYQGWPEHAPFARIIATAAPPEIPDALVDQLAVGGILVLPVGTDHQEIVIVTKTPEGAVTRRTIPVRFVPMVQERP
ncbi:MAG: protein-L-isoaspartate(D-aspartate) O-methyltransferase [Acidimicrobiia bacterium]|nr:protein-L-isoaspartate(D-aspartate) O-methyltransferase [Acidimicrobiia bacterium]